MNLLTPRCEIMKNNWFSFRKPTLKIGISKLFPAYRVSEWKRRIYSKTLTFEGCPVESGFQPCFWVPWKPRNSVISHPVTPSPLGHYFPFSSNVALYLWSLSTCKFSPLRCSKNSPCQSSSTKRLKSSPPYWCTFIWN